MRYNKGLVKIVISLILIVSVLISSNSFVNAASNSYLQNQIYNLEQKQAEIKKRMNNIKSKKDALDEKKKVQQELVENMQALVDACNAKLNEYYSEISTLEREIKDKENEIESTKTAFKRRIRAMYMSGMDTSSISIFLSSKSFSDILAKNEILENISAYDQVLIDKITKSMKVIKKDKAQIEQKRNEQKKIQQKLSSQLSELNTQLSEIKSDVSELQSDYNAAQSQYKKYQQEIAKVHAQMQVDNGSAGQNIVFKGSKFKWPLPGIYTISSKYGYRYGAYSGFHNGIDLSNGATYGKTIIAAADGVVDVAGWNNSYGYYVIINHGQASNGNKYKTLYAHMCRQPSVSTGSTVKAGNTIGFVGSTGDSTGPHLHFSVMVNGSFVNPMNYFS